MRVLRARRNPRGFKSKTRSITQSYFFFLTRWSVPSAAASEISPQGRGQEVRDPAVGPGMACRRDFEAQPGARAAVVCDGHATGGMALGTFAETKVPRLRVREPAL